jgi:hypothetical protein
MSVDLNPHHYTNMNFNFTQQILGSSLIFSALGGRGKEKKEKPAAKNFASPSEGEAEGGCGGNSASPEPKRSPAALLVKSRPPKKSFVFLLEEKIGRAQIKNCEQNFSLSERAKRAAAERIVSSVQKRFALRSVIATNLNIANFAGSLFARSPRLRRGFARIFPYISAQNQTDGQNQKSVFCPAGGGSGRRSRQSKNTPLRNLLKCFCFPIFSVCPDEVGTLRSQFFNPALFPPKAEWPKATY